MYTYLQESSKDLCTLYREEKEEGKGGGREIAMKLFVKKEDRMIFLQFRVHLFRSFSHQIN